MVQTGTGKDPVVERLVQRIVEEIRPRQVFLFGSRAKGSAQPDSDIDLLLIYDGPLSKRDVQRQAHRLFEDDYVPMDIFVLTSTEMDNLRPVANTLAREVAETGVLYYG